MRRAQKTLAGSGVLTPTSLEELANIVHQAEILRFGVGLLAGRDFDLAAEGTDVDRVPELRLDLSALTGVVAFEPADQVVVVRAGTTFKALNESLAEAGQCLPIGPGNVGSQEIGTAMALNYPHTLEAQCGTWRDWVLGLTVVQADGTIAKAGSKAVKNVAGYDVQKLFIGARDSLGVVAEVILRTYPLRALPDPDLYVPPKVDVAHRAELKFIQRVLPSDYLKAIEGASVLIADNQTCTLWHLDQPPRFEHDWLFEIAGPPTFADPVQLRFMQRAKELFDPTHKLNPGVMGEGIG